MPVEAFAGFIFSLRRPSTLCRAAFEGGAGCRNPEALWGRYQVMGREKQFRAGLGLLYEEIKRVPWELGSEREFEDMGTY